MDERDRLAIIRTSVYLEVAVGALSKAIKNVNQVDISRAAKIDLVARDVLELMADLARIETEKLLS